MYERLVCFLKKWENADSDILTSPATSDIDIRSAIFSSVYEQTLLILLDIDGRIDTSESDTTQPSESARSFRRQKNSMAESKPEYSLSRSSLDTILLSLDTKSALPAPICQETPLCGGRVSCTLWEI